MKREEKEGEKRRQVKSVPESGNINQGVKKRVNQSEERCTCEGKIESGEKKAKEERK